MRWLEYYKQEFLDIYESINTIRNKQGSEELLCADYVKMFNTSCELLKLYLNYNGLFQFEPREVIKEAFYVGLIEDGKRWINALSLAEIYKTGENSFNKLILQYCKDENFIIYDNLKKDFESLKEKYERTNQVIL